MTTTRTLGRTAVGGFSLIEIIAAVTIMAIIAAFLIPAIGGYMRRAKVKSTKIVLKNVQNAIEQFHGDTNSYPATLEDLRTRPVDEKVAKRWEGPYYQKEATDTFGSELVYTLNPKGTQPPYELYSWGPHKEGAPEEEWIRASQD